jgi:hypothetical protein
MSALRFEQICRDACLELGIHDTTALAQGRSVRHADILFEALFREGDESFTLVTELGTVLEEHKLPVYESLLTLQTLTWPQRGMRFGFDRERRTAVLCLEVAFGAPLATIIKSLVQQVAHWRETLLVGSDENALSDFFAPGA